MRGEAGVAGGGHGAARRVPAVGQQLVARRAGQDWAGRPGPPGEAAAESEEGGQVTAVPVVEQPLGAGGPGGGRHQQRGRLLAGHRRGDEPRCTVRHAT